MRPLNMKLLLMSLMLFALCTGAAEKPLSLEQCVTMALNKNPDLRIAEKEWKKANAGIWESYSALLPSVDGHINYQHAWDIQTNTIPNFLKPMLGPLASMIPELADMPDYVELSFGVANTISYGATLTQPLFLGGAGVAGVRMAYAGAKAAEQNYESKKQGMIYQVTDAFYGCILARKMVEVQEDALAQAESNYDVVSKKYQVGSASGFEKMRSAVEVANLKPAVISAKHQYESALTGLRMLIGLEASEEIFIDGELSYLYDDYADAGLTGLQREALINRPELSALHAQKKLASNGVTIARSQFMPKVFFNTDYSYLGMRNDMRFTKDDYSKGFTSSLTLQMPLFHSFKESKQYQKAQFDYQITKDMEKQLTDAIMAEVEIAFNKLMETREKYQAANESIELAEEAMRLANLTYEEGASTQLDVLSSQLALTQAKMNHASALYEYLMARYMIRKVTGNLHTVI